MARVSKSKQKPTIDVLAQAKQMFDQYPVSAKVKRSSHISPKE